MQRKPDVTPADHARTLRVYLPELIKRLLDKISEPGFTGGFEVKLSAKDGRPGQPEHFLRTYGIDEQAFFGSK